MIISFITSPQGETLAASILGWSAWAAIISGLVAWFTAAQKIKFDRDKLRREFQLEFATEAAIKHLLATENYSMRSFGKIKHHLKGFTDEDALRRHLIRAGAVCFSGESDQEMWGLLERHKEGTFK
jgi:hypothetical protein